MFYKLFYKQNVLILITGAILASLLIAPGAQSTGPQFNFMANDLELLAVSNVTQQTDWSDPVSANPGDKVAFRAYYHNGVENTVARNTKIKVILPNTASTKLVANSSLWADNAAMVTDTGTINSVEAQTLEYIPGSTKWFKSEGQDPISLPDGITEDGVNIGNIQGCWPYIGYVTFLTKTKEVPTPEPQLVYSKEAWNIIRNVDATLVINKPNEIIEYRLTAENRGNDAAYLQVKDDIGGVLRYANITNLYGSNLSSQVISWPAVTLAPGDSVTKKFRIRIKEAIPANQLVHLINEYGNRVDVPARRDVNCDPGLRIEKVVRNVTQGQTNFTKTNSANPGDVLEYRMKVINEGDIELRGVKVRDILPNHVSYLNNTARYGYGPLAINNPLSNNLVGSGVNLGRLVYQGQIEGYYQWLRIEFRAKVKDNLGIGSYTQKNQVTTTANYTTEVSSDSLRDSNWAITNIKVLGKPALTVSKTVKNITRNTGYGKLVQAYPGDQVGYRIIVSNTGEITITNLQLRDVLPANLDYLNGSAKLIYNGKIIKISDGFVKQYRNLPNLAPGKNLKVVFKGKTDNKLAKGSILVNTAYARGAGLTEKSVAKVQIIKPQVLPAGPLSKTGVGIEWLIAIIALVSIGYWYYAIKLI